MDKSGITVLGIVSSLMHELGHIMAIKCRNYKINGINLGCVGADILLNQGKFTDKIFILLSGSFTNFLVFIVFKILYIFLKCNVFRVIYFQNLCIGILNLLPVVDLDGGYVLLLLLGRKKNIVSASKILNVVSIAFLIPVLVVGVVVFAISKYNFSLLILGIYLAICIFFKKAVNL